jgi:ubiquinone/menaquinone biosynthesis C-methylase UbiE
VSWRRPHAIARQARHASGLLGRLIAAIMARETWAANRLAIEALGVAPGHGVLDVGCGHGRSLAELARRASGGHVIGVDPSELMVAMAIRRNRRGVRAGRIEVRVGRAERLPLDTASVDRVLCVHTLYFWEDLDDPFGEIARVLRPGGRLALLFRERGGAGTEAFPADVYRFPTLEEVGAALGAVGFSLLSAGPAGGQPDAPILVIAERR